MSEALVYQISNNGYYHNAQRVKYGAFVDLHLLVQL